MKPNQLPALKEKSKKRLGRGYGSGKGGHTVGRGSKGQKAREKINPLFEGTKIKKSLLKRLPFQRGKGKFKRFKAQPAVINLKYLNLFKSGETVDFKSLVKKGIIDQSLAKSGVKILGEGKLEVALKVAVPCSLGAEKKIVKAGGKLISAKR